MSQFKPREAYAGRKASGTAMESLWRGFLSLRDPAGASHAAGPPEDFPARPPLTDAPGRVFTRPTGFVFLVRTVGLVLSPRLRRDRLTWGHGARELLTGARAGRVDFSPRGSLRVD